MIEEVQNFDVDSFDADSAKARVARYSITHLIPQDIIHPEVEKVLKLICFYASTGVEKISLDINYVRPTSDVVRELENRKFTISIEDVYWHVSW